MLPFLAILAIGAAPETITVDVDGVARTAIIVVPPGGGKHPVIFGFHGHGGDATYAYNRFDLQDAWPDAIAVYPEGLPTVSRIDPSGRGNGWDVKPDEQNADLKFFDKLYKIVMHKYPSDPRRVFAMGHSNGGMFMYTLWILRSKELAGLGSFEGAGANMGKLSPMPFFITIGEKDMIVPAKLQHTSLSAAMEADGSSQTGQPYGPQGTLYQGKQPLVFWSYDGGHIFQKDAVPTMIKLFQSVAERR